MFSRLQTIVFRSVLIMVLLIIFCVITLFIFVNCSQSRIELNAEEFQKERNYSKEELLLFGDVAFPYNRIRKWNDDIKVEIVRTDRLNDALISEIDSIINILSPLIYPIKMYRVPEHGNLKVHRKVDSIPITTKDARGFCYVPPLIKTLSWDIKYAEVYDIWYSNVIFHEILHAIGLQHPSKEPPFYMRICSAYNFYSLDEVIFLLDNPLYISEEEKLIIKMLYSPHIKPGLKRQKFLQKMNLCDNDT